MKHSVVVKFIAVLLCTASLLGVLGTGLGIFALTETGLYNRTVDQLLEDKIQSEGHALAQRIAARYASLNLGGVPEELVEQRFPDRYYGTFSGNFGYSLKDQDGNILEGEEPENPEQVQVEAFSVNVQYLHLVSLMSEAEKYPSLGGETVPEATVIAEGEDYVYDAVPMEGAAVTQIGYTLSDGHAFDVADDNGLGSVYYTRDGQLICMIPSQEHPFIPNVSVTQIALICDGVLLYEAISPNGVGYFTSSGRNTLFVPTIVQVTQEDSVQTTEATVVVETVPETVPETTVPETTIVETTIPFVPAVVTDNIPQEGLAEVVTIKATLADGRELFHEDAYGVGRLHREDGTVVFDSYERWEAEFGTAVYVCFANEHGETIYEASHEDGIGEISDKESKVSYRAVIPQPPVVETVPETEPHTEPPTEPETVPETVEQTVPEAEPAAITPVMINGKLLEEYDIVTAEYVDWQTGELMYAEYVYTPMQEHTVELYLTEDSLTMGPMYEVLRMVRQVRGYLLPALGGCVLLFFVFGTYLVCAAGHKRDSDVRQAGGLNRIPLDLYLVIVGMGIPCLIALGMEGTQYFLRQSLLVGSAFAAGLSFAGCLLVVGFLFAMVAQVKSPDGYWWRNLLCAWFVRACFRLGMWAEHKCRNVMFPFLGRVCTKLWILCSKAMVSLYRITEKTFLWSGNQLGKCLCWLKKTIHRLLSLLPLTWQWLLCGFLMFFMIALAYATNGEEVVVILCLGFSMFLIVYGAHCFGILLDSTKKMRKGNLDTKVDDRMMVGTFKEFAGELNELAGVAVVAAQKQLNSERMKSELITNVSHDIKTPLTSIINYADLLQKPHTEEEGVQYLEVLSRQSLQLKKLLEDLMEMSKASTGNMNVEITCLDAVEAVNQALGEFSDKLEKAHLTPIFRHGEDAEPVMADGRLVWRVLSNLLGNVVKYAMPGTRVYVDLLKVDEEVVLSIKNISREELTADAEELMERFVRGDDSRNTEGSGLGLNIAKSLMELQKGKMQLLVDGDLFKVTLIFPSAQ